MATYLLRRILLMIPTLVGITAVVFFIMKLAPGDPTQLLLSREGEMRPGDRAVRVAYIKKRYGLDQPAYVQYFRWLNKVSPVGTWSEGDEDVSGWGLAVGTKDGRTTRFGLKTPDFGHSFTKNRSVLALMGEAIPITLLLNFIALPLVYLNAIALGVYAARYRGRAFDLVSGVMLIGLWSIPVIWAGVMLQGFFANEVYFKWFPTLGLHDLRADAMAFLPRWSAAGGFERGWLLDTLWHLALPVVCLTYGSQAFISKLARGALLENLSADYVRTARAKGVGDRDVLWRHAFRNSLLPLITVAAHILPGMLAGSIVIETIFSIPGMGQLIIEAIEFKDQELVMAETLAAGVLSMVAFLIADMLYAAVDPRVSYG